MDHWGRCSRGSLARRRCLRRQRRHGGNGRVQDRAPTVPEKAKTGGKLTVLWTGDVDHIDCGQTYYQMGNFICNATQKQLYNYKPDDGAKMVPDLADGDPQVSEDGKTVTVKIKPGVKYSPPYNKEVTSADVKYAIERGFFTSVASGFTSTYYARPRGREGRRRRPAPRSRASPRPIDRRSS